MEKNKKRKYRELDDTTKQKISLSSKGKHKSETHKQHISKSMIDYWRSIPHRPGNNETNPLNNEK